MSVDPNRAVPGWQGAPRPVGETMEGRLVRVEKLSPAHATDLYAAHGLDGAGANWTYLPYGPFPDAAAHAAWIEEIAAGTDPLFHAVIDRATGRAIGQASFLSIVPEHGAIEVGHIHFSPALQRTPAATETMALMMSWAFEAGYRRYEWKCNASNRASRRAALRLGLSFEGVFRNHRVFKGRNRDTAWFAAMEEDWPAIRDAFARWLDLTNFDGEGRQRVSLATLTRPILRATGEEHADAGA